MVNIPYLWDGWRALLVQPFPALWILATRGIADTMYPSGDDYQYD